MNDIIEQFNDKEAQSTFDPSEAETNKIVVAICYVVSILFFLPILLDGSSNFCKFHANQILTLFISELIVGAICGILGLIPIVGAIIDALIGLAVLALLIGLVYGAVTGKAVRLPFIGNLLKVF